jgi:hypothetical protein
LATLISRANDDFGQAEPARFAANAFAANGSPVYRYRFSCVPTAMREQMRAGAPHGGEIGFVFGTLRARPGSTPSPEDQAVSRMAQSYWINFARTGDPNGADLPVWPRHDPRKDSIFEFRPDGSTGAGPDAREGAAGRHAVGHRIGEAVRFLRPYSTDGTAGGSRTAVGSAGPRSRASGVLPLPSKRRLPRGGDGFSAGGMITCYTAIQPDASELRGSHSRCPYRIRLADAGALTPLREIETATS